MPSGESDFVGGETYSILRLKCRYFTLESTPHIQSRHDDLLRHLDPYLFPCVPVKKEILTENALLKKENDILLQRFGKKRVHFNIYDRLSFVVLNRAGLLQTGGARDGLSPRYGVFLRLWRSGANSIQNSVWIFCRDTEKYACGTFRFSSALFPVAECCRTDPE